MTTAEREKLCARIYARTQQTATGCVEWTGSLSNGYGSTTHKGERHKNHRLTYELAKGPVPDGLVLDHLCRNRACVNPEHLEPVTTRTNVLRGVSVVADNAAKTHCKYGHPYSGENLGFRPSRFGGLLRRCKTCDRKWFRTPETRKQEKGRYPTKLYNKRYRAKKAGK